MRRCQALTAIAATALVLAGCTSSGSANPNASVEMPTASYSPPPDAAVTPPDRITLANVQPNDGIGPIVDFIKSARSSIDISIYRIDSDFEPLVGALAEAAASTNDRRTAGPALGMATPRMTKIPLPMMDPTLKKRSAERPIVRLSSP
ncbi:MAG: hypothetical protein ACKOFP_00250 [Actinomycetota bacterium]